MLGGGEHRSMAPRYHLELKLTYSTSLYQKSGQDTNTMQSHWTLEVWSELYQAYQTYRACILSRSNEKFLLPNKQYITTLRRRFPQFCSCQIKCIDNITSWSIPVDFAKLERPIRPIIDPDQYQIAATAYLIVGCSHHKIGSRWHCCLEHETPARFQFFNFRYCREYRDWGSQMQNPTLYLHWLVLSKQ